MGAGGDPAFVGDSPGAKWGLRARGGLGRDVNGLRNLAKSVTVE